ncbi:MAG: hypothetical protein KJ915_09975 [Candidatus Omnitrophica bacterium]|nr:hypothetical protein [Candidatus Omnitrophota bacterium]
MKKTLAILIIGIFTLSLAANAFSFEVNGKEYFHPVDATTLTPVTTNTYVGAVIGDPDYNCTPTEANAKASCELGTYILDVRTPSEWIWVGHPGKNKVGAGTLLDGKVLNLPWLLWGFDKKSCSFSEKGNDYFEQDAQTAFDGIENPIAITMCRSGTRSVWAAEALEAMGIPALNMLTGFEGSTDANGYRTKNGWKIDGCPYSYSAAGVYSNRKALK